MNELSTRQRYQRIAPLYDLLDLPFEYRRYRQLRPLLFAGMSGLILDAGVGTGRNLPFYPSGAKVTGIDLSAAMLARARQRLGQARAAVELREMDVTHLDFPDQHFDSAVATFLFCVLPDEKQTPALAEIKRVLKPGGILRLLEYTRPTDPFRRAVTKLWEPWVHWAYGASFDRNTEQYIPAAGLQLADSRFVVGDLIKLMTVRKAGGA
ncbi:MAG: class I SAM-dependent methyltransferase [Xanthobacteraceae bacterium]